MAFCDAQETSITLRERGANKQERYGEMHGRLVPAFDWDVEVDDLGGLIARPKFVWRTNTPNENDVRAELREFYGPVPVTILSVERSQG